MENKNWFILILIFISFGSFLNNLNFKSKIKKIIWTDCDREGEHIGQEIVDICKNVKKTIVVKRARFSSVTPRFFVFSFFQEIIINDFN